MVKVTYCSWKNCNQQDLHSQCENLKIIIFKVHMVALAGKTAISKICIANVRI